MKADLILSRSNYQAGTPVVGTVRIHHAEDNNAAASATAANHDDGGQQLQQTPIRDEIVSARLYLAGRAHLGSTAHGKVSKWRSTQEINQLKKIYGEHACLTMAKIDEQSRWKEWNNCSSIHAEASDYHGGSCSISSGGANHKQSKATTFCTTIPPPQVTHVEQAERLAVHSCLHHSYTSHKTIHEHTNSTYDNETTNSHPTNNDYSNLPTPHENNAICFWMTNVLELLDIPERHLDRQCTCVNKDDCNCEASHLRPGRGKFHGDMYPYRPLQLPDLNVVRDALRGVDESNAGALQESEKSEISACGNDCEEKKVSGGQDDTDSTSSVWERIVASANPDKESNSGTILPLEQMQVAVSFRADLPSDVPPTMSAECVKYFYSAVLVVTTAKGEVSVDKHNMDLFCCMFTIFLSQ